MTILYEHFWWQFLTILTIFNNFWQLLKILTIFNNFDICVTWWEMSLQHRRRRRRWSLPVLTFIRLSKIRLTNCSFPLKDFIILCHLVPPVPVPVPPVVGDVSPPAASSMFMTSCDQWPNISRGHEILCTLIVIHSRGSLTWASEIGDCAGSAAEEEEGGRSGTAAEAYNMA